MQKCLKSHTLALFLCSFLSFGTHYAIGQTSSKTLSKAFDQAIGKENLELSNGPVHVTEFRIYGNKHNFYPADSFEKGNITYNNQEYFDIDIKYDLYKDILLYKPQASEAISINLIQEKVSKFTINQRNFIFLDKLLYPLSPISSGYYEENFSGKDFTFYIKHHRDKQDVIKGTSIFHEFDDNYEYYLKKGSSFFIIDSKKDIIKLFPEQKRKINEFYAAFRKMANDDQPKFYEKLIAYLQNSTDNTQD